MTTEIPEEMQVTLNSLNKNRFDARFARTAAEAREIMLEMIPLEAAVGVGDSATLRQLGVLEELVGRGTEVINPFTRELAEGMAKDPAKHELFIETVWRTLGKDIYVTGCNAVTRDGRIVSVDYAGNRVAGTLHGAKRVILAAGRNKIVEDVDRAIHRIKNVISPAHCKRKGRKTPCVVTGECNECDSPDRFCGATIILERKLAHIDLSIILINEDLGLGWSPEYEEKRIDGIKAGYYDHTWFF